MDGSSGELHVVESFELESGRVLRDVGVKYKTWGALNAARDNVLVVCHALTGSHELELWWGDLLGPGRAFDTDRYFVVCVNTLGSPYGSCSPLTPDGDAADGSAYGARFPHDATIRDAVGLQALVLKDAIGVDRVACAVGGSMGGMLALELCYQADVPVESAVLLATNGRHGAWQIAISALQRQAGQHKRAKFPTSKAHISAVFHSFRLIFGRAIISRNGVDAWMLFPERARAEHSR